MSALDCGRFGAVAQSLLVHVIGCCSEGKHYQYYLRSVEPVKCWVCVCVSVCVNVLSADVCVLTDASSE